MAREVTEKIFWAVVLFVSSGALLPLLLGDRSVVYSIFWGTIYLITLFKFRSNMNSVLRLFIEEKMYLLTLLFILASVLWSVFPGITFKHFLTLLGTTIIGAYLGSRYDMREIVDISLAALGVGMILSILSIVCFPRIAQDLDQYDLAWKGVYATKNSLGRLMAYSIVLILVRFFWEKQVKLVQFFYLIFSVLLLMLSGSKTGIGVVIAMGCVILCFKYKRLISKKLILAIASIALLLLISIVNYLEALLELFGRDLTFTGRTVLWELSIEKLLEKPFLGYGYDAFWQGWDGPSSDIWNILRWEPPHSHNGFIDVALNLGLIGLVIFTIGYLFNLRRAFEFSVISVYPFVASVFILFYNISESSFLVPNSFFWIIYVAMLGYTLNQHKMVNSYNEMLSN